MSANTTIYSGFWVNHAKGEVLGATLSLKKSNAAFLIAALAVFIQLIGFQSWGIMRFVAHQMRATPQERDGLFHQQQATLRNENSDVSTIWVFSRLAYAWRSRAPKSFLRSGPIVLVALLHIIAFTAASILASRITTTDEEVLISRNPYCGQWGGFNGSYTSDYQNLALAWGYTFNTVQDTDKYVQSCLTSPQSLPECTMFTTPRLNWTSTRNSSCPFRDLCLGEALYIDTGLIDSRDDLGINSGDNDRVQWRHNMTCAPITSKGYAVDGTSTRKYQDHNGGGVLDFNYTALYYGPALKNVSLWGVDDPALWNATYIYTNFGDASVLSGSNAVFPAYYKLAMVVDEEDNENFDPIPDLVFDNATLMLAFATPSVSYTGPSDDLWLSAHDEGQQSVWNSENPDEAENITIYWPDNKVSVLACLEQHQICNPNTVSGKESCTPLRTMYHDFEDEELEAVLTTGHQMAIARNILGSILALDYYVDDTPLLAESSGAYGLSLPLAADQWIQEVENWVTIGLATTQRFMLEYITGPASSEYLPFINTTVADTDHDVDWMCRSQIINHGDYTNFRTLTISLIFALGVIVYVANQSLEFITGAVRQRWKSGRWRQRAWWSEGTLQLQRRTFEVGSGVKWQLDDWDRIPITESGVNFTAVKNWDDIRHEESSLMDSSSKPSHDSSEPKRSLSKSPSSASTISRHPGGVEARQDNLDTIQTSDGDAEMQEVGQEDNKPKPGFIVHVDSISSTNSESSINGSHGR